MKKRATIALFILIVAALTALVLFISLHKARSSSEDRQLADQIQLDVLHNDLAADSKLRDFFRSAKPEVKVFIEGECLQRVMQGLNTRDNVLWKPYKWIQTNAPTVLARFLPPWQQPRITRKSTAAWLDRRGLWDFQMLSSNSCAIVTPVLLNLAETDPDSSVRTSVFWALGSVGDYSSEIEQMMTDAIHHDDMRDRQAATWWFARNTVAADKIVPLLLRGLEDDAMRSDYANALRAYGPKARFVADSLISLARTNNPATSSVATWALLGIDHNAALKAGVKW